MSAKVLDLQAAREKREGWEVLTVLPEIQARPIGATRYEVTFPLEDGETITFRINEGWLLAHATRFLRAINENPQREGAVTPDTVSGLRLVTALTDGVAEGVRDE
jgi:hypothetical protein